jgi:hypothetical protein
MPMRLYRGIPGATLHQAALRFARYRSNSVAQGCGMTDLASSNAPSSARWVRQISHWLAYLKVT